MRIDTGRLLFGFVLVVLGIIFLLDQAGIVSSGSVIGTWWPVVIILAGVIQWLVAPRAWIGPGIVALIGLILLASNLDILPGSAWSIFWPLVLIVIGARFLMRRQSHLALPGSPANRDPSDTVNTLAIFSGNRTTSDSVAFQGGSLTAIFGGASLDLSHAQLSPAGAVLDAVAIFGGVDILVPPGWQIAVSGVPIFGGVSDKTIPGPPGAMGTERLTVRGTALFGGVEVKTASVVARAEG